MKKRHVLWIMCLVAMVGLVVSACAVPSETPEPAAPEPAAPKDPFVVGVTGGMSGPVASTYLPGLELVRCYIENLNDEGGIDGRMIELNMEDDRGDPARAASSARKFSETGVHLMVSHSVTATYSGIVAEIEKANIPLIVGGTASPAWLAPNPPHPLIFMGTYGGCFDAQALWIRLLKVHYGPGTKVGWLGVDIPGSRYATQKCAEYCEKEGLKSIEAYVPMGTTDLSAVALTFYEEGDVDVISFMGPGRLGPELYNGLVKLGWEGDLSSVFAEDVEGAMEIAKLNQIDIVQGLLFAPWQENTEEHQELLAIANKYKAASINSMSFFGFPVGPQMEAIFRGTGYPVTTEKMLEVMNNLELDLRPFTGVKGRSETDHVGPIYQRLYILDKNGGVTPGTSWYKFDQLTQEITDIGQF